MMQKDKKTCSKSSTYTIQKRGARDSSRVEKFSTYTWPDPTTRWILATSSVQWTQNPLSFWTPPGQPVESRATPGELIKFYINAKCEDH